MMIAIPPQAIKSSLLEFLNEFWNMDHDYALMQANRPLKAKAEEVATMIQKSAITIHPIYNILTYVLHDMVDHCSAIDSIGENRAMLLHVRHVEELYTVSKYLLTTPDRYKEFAWRWNSFPVIHAIRNRVLNLKKPLDASMVKWIEENLEPMKQHFSKKFEADPTQCFEQWEKLSSWLYKIPISAIFEKAGRITSYTSEAYDWNSQTVHLSPLGNTFMAYELPYQNYYEISIDSTVNYLNKMCHECSVIVADQKSLRNYYLKQTLLETYEMLCTRPAHYIELAKKKNQYDAFTKQLLKKPFNFEEIMNITLSPPIIDPLLLNISNKV